MTTVLIAGLCTIIGSVITGLCTRSSYHETSNATITSTKMMDKANAKNTRIAQYNDLFQRSDKLSEELYQAQRESIHKSQDYIVLFYELGNLIEQLKANNLTPHHEAVRVYNNSSRKLHEDSNNSL